MRLSSLAFIFFVFTLQISSYSCIRYFLHNTQLSQKNNIKSNYLDYNTVLSLLDSKALERLTLQDEGSFILEDGAKIIVLDKFSPDIEKNQVLCASAKFLNELNTTGWNKLYVKTYKECPVLMQMFGAGVLEGSLTFQQINDFYTNVRADHEENSDELEKLGKFFEKIDHLIDTKIKNPHFFQELNQTNLNYWSQITLSKAQLLGVSKGFNSRVEKKLNLVDFYFINADGQISELLEYMEYKKTFKSAKETIQTQLSSNRPKEIDVVGLLAKSHSENLREFWVKSLRKSHCSVFVKPIFNNEKKVENILVSHSTWDDYNAMIRIFKHYDLALDSNNSNFKFDLKSHNVTFSSYPGCISSTDDFYMINDKLMVTETTLGILNSDSYSKILPEEEYVPDFMRILLANRLANTAKEWVEWFMMKNTGTYNSQWTVVDLKKFEQSLNKTSIEKETILVLEQFPSEYHYEDITHYVEKNQFWASFNVPFFTSTRRESGYTQLESEEPSSFSYSNSIRGKTFTSKNPGIHTLEDLKHLMLYNPWKRDDIGISGNGVISFSSSLKNENPAEAIGSRYDLLDGWFDNFGEIDVKICDFEMMMRHECFTISGPSHQDLPVFKWSLAKKQQKHQGLVDEWNFDWIQMNPQVIIGQKKS